jgi:hypothetical protein
MTERIKAHYRVITLRIPKKLWIFSLRWMAILCCLIVGFIIEHYLKAYSGTLTAAIVIGSQKAGDALADALIEG